MPASRRRYKTARMFTSSMVTSVRKELKLSNKIEELEPIKQAIASLLTEGQPLENAEFEMTLIAEELFTNAVFYGFADHKSHEIRMSLEAGAGHWEITMEDEGLPFDPTAAPETNTSVPLDERDIGGLGIHLIRKIAHQFQYERKDGKNVVRVRKG